MWLEYGILFVAYLSASFCFRLTAIQFGIYAVFGQQLGVATLLHNASSLYNTNSVGILHRG